MVDKLAHRPICSITIYGNTVMLTHLHTYLSLLSHYNGLKLNTYESDHKVHNVRNIHYLALYIKCFQIPSIDHANQGRQIFITNWTNKNIQNMDFCNIISQSYNHHLLFISILCDVVQGSI